MSQTSGRPLPDTDDKDSHSIPFRHDILAKKHLSHIQAEPPLRDSQASSLPHTTQPSDSLSVKIDLDLLGASSDFGLPNSSFKTPGGLQSIVCSSDSGYGERGEDSQVPFQGGHVRTTNSFNPPYDEEVRLDSSTGGSSIESPRSEASATQDEYNMVEEGTEMNTLAYKETVGESKHSYYCWDYTGSGKHSDDEDMEDEEEERGRQRGSRSLSSCMPSFSRQVDEGISYNLKPQDEPGTGQAGRRTTFTSYSLNENQYSPEGSRDKNDKKKTKARDDSDKAELSGLVDVNGNPRSLEPANYSQMRQLARGKTENTAPGGLSGLTPSAISQSFALSSSDQHALDRKKERKRMKLERQKWIPAEAYKDHKNFSGSSLEEILNFVEGSNSSAKAEGKSAKKKQERSKKKDHHCNGTATLEETAGEDGPRSPTETVVVTYAAAPGAEAMGNSTGKSHGEDIISRSGSTKDSFDKNSEFHDCLNTLPSELIISDKIQQSDKFENLLKNTASNSMEANTKVDNSSEKILTELSKSLNKKSTKTKGKKERQDISHDNGPLSPKPNMKSNEGLAMKNSLLPKSDSVDETIKFHYSSDTEHPPDVRREDSFTEVKKKKKRIGGKEMITAATYHSHSNNGHLHRNNFRPRPSTPPPSLSGGTISKYCSLPVTGPTHSSRDLSPSAFPVLAGHGLVAPHLEARRNSCGDLNTESIDSKTYDSDRESAKSLPEAHGIRVGDISPAYPVSYARIAAAPRRNENTNSPSSESGVASGSQNSSVNSSMTHTPGSSIDITSPQSPSNTVVTPERKATVWKGSPRERRHSIGSSPEDKAEGEKSSVAQRNRQCGSQEVLSRNTINLANVAAKDEKTSAIEAVKLTSSNENQNSYFSEASPEKSEQSEVKYISSQPKQIVTSSQVLAKPSAQPVSKSGPLEYAYINSNDSNAQGSYALAMSKSSSSNVILPKDKMDLDLNSAHISAPNSSKTEKKVSSQTFSATSLPESEGNDKTVAASIRSCQVSGPQTARKSSSTNNTKSVIFLDRRFGASSPQNLGITFGFDSSIDSVNEPASQTQPSFPSHTAVPSPSSLQSSSADPSTQPSRSQPLLDPAAHRHIPPAVQTAACSPDPPLFTNSSSNNNDSNKPVPKGPHIQGPRNGLILSSSSAILQEQVGNCSISVNDNNNTNVAVSSRTSHSTPETESSSHRISSPVAPSPLVLPGLQCSAPVTVAISPVALVNESMPHIDKLNSSITVIRANPIGVTYSPSYPPPPLPQAVLKVAGDNRNTNSITSALPSALELGKQNVPVSVISKPGNPLTVSPNSQEIADAPLTSITASELQSASGVTSQHCQPSVPAKTLQPSVRIVYGEKIKPVAGCGQLMFVPHNIPQKCKGNVAEIGNFLRKKWFEDVAQKKGMDAFSTLIDD